MDLSQLSDADLQAISSGDMSKVSDEGLTLLAGPTRQSTLPEHLVASWDRAKKDIIGTVDDVLPIVPAIAEPVAHLATASVAPGIAGMVSFGALGADLTAQVMQKLGLDAEDLRVDPEGVRQKVMNALTYRPTGDLSTTNYNPLVSVPKAVGTALSAGPSALADVIQGDQSSPTRNLAASTVREAGPALLAYGAGKVLASAPVQNAGNSIVESVMSRHLQSAEDLTRRAFRDTPNAEQLLRQGASSGQPMTAADAVTPNTIRSPGPVNNIPAALEDLVRNDPNFLNQYSALDATQKAAVLNRLSQLSGGATQTAAMDALNAAKQRINTQTEAVRQGIIGDVNTANTITANANATLPGIEKTIAQNSPWTLYPDELAAAKAKHAAITEQLGSLEANKLSPITPRSLMNAVDEVAQKTGSHNFETQSVLNDIKARINAAATDNNGYLTVDALHDIRKAGINQAIDKATQGAETATKQGIVRNVTQVKPLFDDVIDAAAGGNGTRWTDYLRSYSQKMNEVNRMQMGQTAQALYKQSPSEFVKLVNGERPDIVTKVFGDPTYSFSDAMGAHAIPYIKAAQAVQRGLNKAAASSEGGVAAARIAEDNMASLSFPNLLSRKVALVNKGLKLLEKDVNAATLDATAKAMLSPQNMLDLWYRKPYQSSMMTSFANPNFAPLIGVSAQGMMTGAQDQ